MTSRQASRDDPAGKIDRQFFMRGSMTLLSAAASETVLTANGSDPFATLRDKPLEIGMLIFPQMDQIDFTGPFAVLSRIPNTVIYVLAPELGPLKDHKGLILTPTDTVANAPPLDVLQVSGGPGQQAMMHDEAVLSLIRGQMARGKPLFSVCTGALICGAAGVLRGRRATTHWTALDLLPYFGATAVDARVVVDGNLVTAAGLTAGIDGALTLASLLRGEGIAQQIQLEIQYAPEPPFNAGAMQTAPADVIAAVRAKYRHLTEARERTARTTRYAWDGESDETASGVSRRTD
jgi:cyclohexyl-isocyanide hydratase